LLALTALVITPIAPESLSGIEAWALPSGGAAAVIVAAWLVEAKKSVIENIAPVLTAIFTPLFALMLGAAVVLYAVAGIGREFDRDLLTGFDALLLVVLGLVLYGLSARPEAARAGVMDVIRLVTVVPALVLDALVLGSLADRRARPDSQPGRGNRVERPADHQPRGHRVAVDSASDRARTDLRSGALADVVPAGFRRLGGRGGVGGAGALRLRLIRACG
jgi:hypothetical protein